MNVVVGTVSAPIARATLAIGDERHSRQQGDQLVLVVEGVTQRFLVGTPVFLDQRELADRWADLAGDPFAQLFRDVAPGDHVRCEIAGWSLEPGDHVTVAVVADRITVMADGSDEATRARVSEAADALLERKEMKVVGTPPSEPAPHKPWRGSIRAFGTFGIGGAIVSAVTWIDPRTLLDKNHNVPFALGLLVPSLVMICMMLMLVLTRPWLDVVETQTTPSRFRASWSVGNVASGILAGVFVLDLSVGLMMMGLAPKVALPIRFFALALIAGFTFVLALRKQRPQRRLAGLLRGSGVVRGVLVAPAPPLVYGVRYDREVRTHGPKAERETIWYDGVRTIDVAKPFSIESDGRRMEVAGARILWGAPLAYVPLAADERGTSVVAKTISQIEPGASVLIRGKLADVDGVPTFQATGAESFVLFGAPGDARSALRRLFVRWYAIAALLVAIALGATAFGIYCAKLEPIPAITAEKPL